MADNSNNHRTRRFRSTSGGQRYDVEIEGAAVKVDGARHDVSFVQVRPGFYSLLFDGKSYSMLLTDDGEEVRVSVVGTEVRVRVQNEKDLLLEKFGGGTLENRGVREMRAPMPGLVVRVLVNEGDVVPEGHGLIVLEAMKMENEIKAPSDGRIARIHAASGDAVVKNDLLIEFDATAVVTE